MGSQDEEVGERVESLLAQLARQGGKRAAATAEDLIRVLVDYYGTGLGRIVEMIVAADPALLTTMAADPMVESQLILHGLHPVDVNIRVEQALDRIRPYLGSHAGGVEYFGIDEAGVAHLRLDGSCHGCPSSTVTVRMTIEEAVLKAAPEVAGIEVEGQSAPPERLLQIGRGPGLDAALPGPRWRAVPVAELPEIGQFGGVRIDGAQLVLCRLGDTFYAYADTCPTCGSALTTAGSRLAAELLQCGTCAARYDVRLAGKAQDGTGRHLAPLPLLDDEVGVRVALAAEVLS
jgi:Fe-S cluster biogenesis protein NfuA/nitrite reductase/ring-hydroxylating ferredoxin subunit